MSDTTRKEELYESIADIILKVPCIGVPPPTWLESVPMNQAADSLQTASALTAYQAWHDEHGDDLTRSIEVSGIWQEFGAWMVGHNQHLQHGYEILLKAALQLERVAPQELPVRLRTKPSLQREIQAGIAAARNSKHAEFTTVLNLISALREYVQTDMRAEDAPDAISLAYQLAQMAEQIGQKSVAEEATALADEAADVADELAAIEKERAAMMGLVASEEPGSQESASDTKTRAVDDAVVRHRASSEVTTAKYTAPTESIQAKSGSMALLQRHLGQNFKLQGALAVAALCVAITGTWLVTRSAPVPEIATDTAEKVKGEPATPTAAELVQKEGETPEILETVQKGRSTETTAPQYGVDDEIAESRFIGPAELTESAAQATQQQAEVKKQDRQSSIRADAKRVKVKQGETIVLESKLESPTMAITLLPVKSTPLSTATMVEDIGQSTAEDKRVQTTVHVKDQAVELFVSPGERWRVSLRN